MRPVLVLLLVAAASAAFFLALNSGAGEGPQVPLQSERPGTAPKVDPVTMTNLESGPGSRTDAQVTSPSQTRELHPSARGGNALRGQVVRQDGTAVSGALVVLTRYGPTDFLAPMGNERVPDRSEESDVEGNFTFVDVVVGVDYTVVASHPDHGRRTEPFLSVADGELSEPIQVVLQTGSRVRGTVTDSSSLVIEGASVRLSRLSVGSLEDGAGVLRAQTGPAGAYSFENVTQGFYNLTVQHPGFGKTQIQRVEVSGQEEVVNDIQLEVAHLIAGVIRNSDNGAPVAGAKVEAYSTDRRQEVTNTHTLSREDGYFEFDDVRQGSYTLLVRAVGFENKRTPRVETGEVNIDLDLAPLPQVSGVVLGADGAPLRNFVVQLRQPLANTEKTVPVSDSRLKVTEAEAGAFTLACPRVGEFVVEALNPRYAAGFSAPFTVEKGGGLTGLVVQLTSGGALKGRVVDAERRPVAGALVSTHHTDYVDDPFWRSLGDAYPSAATRKETRTNSEGLFELKNLTAEVYQLNITHAGHAPLTLRGLEVDDGSTKDLPDAVLQVGATISGTVFGPAGTGLAGALVQVVLDTQVTQSEYGAFHKARTNSEGRYTFKHLPASHYTVSVQRQGATDNPFVGMSDQKATRKSIRVIDGQSYTQDFTLSN